jgi:pyruvate/2-oxoglutarate dehydrogenase complex dihydrolipoamide acyltransferase (E2) component
MPIIDSAPHRHAATILATVTLASLGLTACGGSSSGTTSHANAAATGTSGTTTSTTGASTTSTSTTTPAHPGAPGTGRSRFPTIRECLQKNGVALPKPSSGGVAGGARLPKGVTRAKLQAALKKCGAGNAVRAFGGPNGPGARRLNSPVFQQALTRYAACLRQNGVNIPAPNTSGKGPVFSTKGIDTSSPKFRAAAMKCRASLIGAFRHARGPAE